jgi:hypothetical protein
MHRRHPGGSTMTPVVRPLPDPQPLAAAVAAGPDPGRLRQALGRLERGLRGHARAVDEAGGLLDERDRTRPALGRRERRLLGDLGGLLRRAGELRRRLERGESPGELCEEVRGLAAAVRRHRHGGVGLVQEAALEGDLGAGE